MCCYVQFMSVLYGEWYGVVVVELYDEKIIELLLLFLGQLYGWRSLTDGSIILHQLAATLARFAMYGVNYCRYYSDP